MKKHRPDEYFNNGAFEIARYGNNICFSNILNEESNTNRIDAFAQSYDDITNSINTLINSIRTNIQKVSPDGLMNYMVSMNYLLMLDKKSESEYSLDDDFYLKGLEYIQSILVSSPRNTVQLSSDSDNEAVYSIIREDAYKLYKIIPKFYLCWLSKNRQTIDLDTQEYILNAQLMSNVRGKQYQNFRIDVLKALLEEHSNEIQIAYGITFEELITGLVKLEKNLSTGKLDAVKQLALQMDKLSSFAEGTIPESYHKDSYDIIERSFGLSLYDIKKTTGWPDELINDLTFDLGEESDFFEHAEFPGWPIWNLPIQKKPCIRINGISYVFDYYSLFDNFYRVFQKSIVKRIEDGATKWKETQTHSSEHVIGKIFQTLLPGSIVHIGNYYPLGKRNSAENDILIEYKDALIIAEVKAGSFTYTPALTDFKAHKKSLEDLVEKGERQCLRTKKYLDDNSCSIFYTNNDLKEESFRIQTSKYTSIYMLDVTIDDFNEIASRMEKIHIADTKEDIITISLNDLWIYKEYFDNSYQFIHYLSQRTAATRIKNLTTFDELDHLGLYIEHNLYSLHAQNIGTDFSNIFFDGYRKDLDFYFAHKHLGKNAKKPSQVIPVELQRIIQICSTKKNCNVTQFTNFLLDMSSECRADFCNHIIKTAKREKELGRMTPLAAFCDVNFCLFIKIDDITLLDRKKQIEYLLANIAKNKRPYCYLIEITLDENYTIVDVEFQYFKQDDIPHERYDELLELGERYARNREIQFVRKYKSKIGRNEQCPCGSGKKYKKCCGC